MHNNIYQALSMLGFNEKEIKIYLAGIKVGVSPASNLGKKTDIPRSTAQYTCNSLVEKGVFSVVERGNTKYYTAENPNKLLTIVNKEYDQIEKKLISTKRSVSQLQEMMSDYSLPAKVKYYHGAEEMITLIDEVFTNKGVLYGAFKLDENMHPKIADFFNNTYKKKRDKYNFPSYTLVNTNENSLEYLKEDEDSGNISLLVDEKNYPFEGVLHMYDNKIALYSYNSDEISGMLIESKSIFTSFLSIFKLAWNSARNLPLNKQFKNVELP